MDTENYYKPYYTAIFALFYLVQGIVQGIPILIFPIYIGEILGAQFDITLIASMAFWGTLPWSLKMIIGVFNDRWGSAKYGRRFPFIISFGCFGAIWWFIMAIYLPTDSSIYLFMTIYYFMTAIGMGFADTALDGLMLDVTPKEKLARVQGFTWTCLLLGMGGGAMVLGYLFLSLNLMPILFIMTGILMIIASVLPRLIIEPPLSQITAQEFSKDIITLVTKRTNWKLFIYTFTASFSGAVIPTFFGYVILTTIGVISVESTLLSITGGATINLLGWSTIFYLSQGIGTILGSLLSGKNSDKERRKTALIAYYIYLPLMIFTVVPFILTSAYLPAVIFGILLQIALGFIQAWLLISGNTIRGDIAKKEYPGLKSTYYSVLISFWNFGQSFGSLAGGTWLISFLVSTTTLPFLAMYFILCVLCSSIMLVSFLLFRIIDPKLYEFEKAITEKSV